VQLDVTFLGARIMTSGLVFPWRPDPENRHHPQLLVENTAAKIAAAAVPAIGYTAVPSVAATPSRDATGTKTSSEGSDRGGTPRDLLDSSDLVSLDLTVRGTTTNSGGGGVLEAAANRLKASRPPSNLSKVVEEEASQMSCGRGSVAAILDNSTPFSPLSDRCPVSTLKDTVSTASRLQKALAIVESVDDLPSLIHPNDEEINSNEVPPAAKNGDGHQLTFGNSMADPEDSILRPSTSADRLSVEDMQRSLSREGSPNNTTAACGPEEGEGEGSMLTFMNPAVSVAERSISFAPTTTQVRCPRKRVAKFSVLFLSTVFSKSSLRYRSKALTWKHCCESASR
jgi:hypothetical protein